MLSILYRPFVDIMDKIIIRVGISKCEEIFDVALTIKTTAQMSTEDRHALGMKKKYCVR